MKSYLLCLMLAAGCAAWPDANAEEACRRAITTWDTRVRECRLTAGNRPSPDQVCPLAYSWDEQKYYDECMPWIESAECKDLGDFQAHCGAAIHLKTW